METPEEKLFGATYSNRQLFGGFWKLAKPYWFSEERWAARGTLLLVVALILSSVFLAVQFNVWYQSCWDALQKYNLKLFWALIGKFCILATFWILIGVFRQFFSLRLQNRWRRWMTRRFLEHWLSEKSHYLWQLTEKKTDNPDQRIAEDVRDFVSNSLDLSLGLLNQVVTLFSFITILWTMSGPLSIPLGGGKAFSLPGYMAWACLFYSVLGTWINHRIGRPLIGLNYRQQLVEANFRFSLVRLRENGESVALCDGEPVEEESLKAHFQYVFSNFNAIIFKQLHLNLFASGYGQLALIFPLVVASPRFFAKEIGIGGLQRVMDAFGRVQGALSWAVDNYVTLAYWRSVVERLEGFETEVALTKRLRAQAQGILQAGNSPGVLKLEHLTLSLPGQARILTPALEMEFQKGRSVLISGPSGCGKSTLLRALHGIWPFAGGRAVLPPNLSMMVMPQKPYLPVGTLKACLTYPKPAEEASDAQVREILSLCRLDNLSGRLEESENWALMLSVGEQQRVAWARVFLHKPEWLFLDEATSALDEDAQERLYRALKERLPGTTMISVAHRQEPREKHQMVWDILSGRQAEPV
jgi:vitamin B12/bleomycin/antimicrobial peptide transport system ATP-binding/permease protein